MTILAEARDGRGPIDWAGLARHVHLEVDANLRIDTPFGPLHLRSEDRCLVIGVGGWGSALRMALWSLRARTVPTRSFLAALATSTDRPVYLDAGPGPRLRLASP